MGLGPRRPRAACGGDRPAGRRGPYGSCPSSGSACRVHAHGYDALRTKGKNCNGLGILHLPAAG
eukprot:9769041-Heterocapsa_arctica.AAC.1